ncbi:hypothetical protein EE612_058814 [Oryza sativa]|nr:hypothetical protein EE612_058814 [Oryza sativa]
MLCGTAASNSEEASNHRSVSLTRALLVTSVVSPTHRRCGSQPP